MKAHSNYFHPYIHVLLYTPDKAIFWRKTLSFTILLHKGYFYGKV